MSFQLRLWVEWLDSHFGVHQCWCCGRPLLAGIKPNIRILNIRSVLAAHLYFYRQVILWRNLPRSTSLHSEALLGRNENWLCFVVKAGTALAKTPFGCRIV